MNINKCVVKKCDHGRQKRYCKICGGSSMCIHGRVKYSCNNCKESAMCIHEKRKTLCKLCGGGSICEHQLRRAECILCDGSQLCEHKIDKRRCKVCNLSSYLIHLQRTNLNRVLKQSSIIKTGHSIDYLGCDSIYFKDYIQSKMIDCMNWDNIHLDHIKPISKFNLDDETEFLDCCHYTNFQPLLAKDNISKSAKWSETDELFWVENIKRKEYLPLYLPV